jgi:hypothetical protein
MCFIDRLANSEHLPEANSPGQQRQHNHQQRRSRELVGDTPFYA